MSSISSTNVKHYNRTLPTEPDQGHTVHIERTTPHPHRSINPTHDLNTCCVAGRSSPPLHPSPLHHREQPDQSQADEQERPPTQDHCPTLQRFTSTDHSMVSRMKFLTAYLTALFFALFGAAQFADHIGAKQCQRHTDMTYDQCRQHKP